MFQNSFFQRVGSSLNQKRLQYSIITGVLLLSVFVAIRPTSRSTLLLLGALAGAAAAIYLLGNKKLGLFGFVVACLFVPDLLGSGGMGALLSPPVLLLVLVLGLWIFDMVVRRRKVELNRSRTTSPALVFIVVALVAFLNGQINYYSLAHLAPITAQVGGLAVFILSIGLFLVAANLIDSLKPLMVITWLYIIFGSVYIVGRLVPQIGGFILPLYQYGSDTSFFWIWLSAMTSSQFLFNNQLDKRTKWALGGFLAVMIYVALSQLYIWKSGWIPALVVVFVVSWIGFPRFRIPGLIVAGGAVLLYLFGNLGDVVAGGEDYSIMTRVVAWNLVLEIVKVNPILGLGMSNYYWYTPLFPILGYSVNYNSHNNYIDIIAQTGIIGLVVFLWFIVEVGRVGWSLLERVPEGFARAYVIGSLGGLAGMIVSGMLGDWILPFVYNVGLHGLRASLIGWLFLGGLVALEQIYRNPEAADLQE